MRKFAAFLALSCFAAAQSNVTVSGSVTLLRKDGKGAHVVGNSAAVVWLKPVSSAPKPEPKQFEIKQIRKCFDPHVLAVPVGSRVAFPNLDPFLHNVFSMFDGRRFDLGLYESGASHSATFDRVGVCYIFCNIHPEMSAAVVVLDTAYYAVSNSHGIFTIADVPEGRYIVNVWHERARPENPREFPREITLSSPRAALPAIRLVDSGQLLIPHKNKYGVDYDTPPVTVYK